MVFMLSAASIITQPELGQCGKPKLWPTSCTLIFFNWLIKRGLAEFKRYVETMQATPGQKPSPKTPQSWYLDAGFNVWPCLSRLVVEISLFVSPKTQTNCFFFCRLKCTIRLSARYLGVLMWTKAWAGKGCGGNTTTLKLKVASRAEATDVAWILENWPKGWSPMMEAWSSVGGVVFFSCKLGLTSVVYPQPSPKINRIKLCKFNLCKSKKGKVV